MANFKIYNVIFYNKSVGNYFVKKSIIIHNNGVIIKNDYNKGIEAVQQLLRENGIDTKKGFKELVNKKFIYVLTEEEVKRDLKKYTPTPEEKAIYKFMESARRTSNKPKVEEIPPIFVEKQEEKTEDEEDPLICKVMAEVNNSKPLKEDEEIDFEILDFKDAFKEVEEKKPQIDEFYEEFDDSFKTENEIDLDISKIKSKGN